MIKEFVERWEANKAQLEEKIRTTLPDSYKELVVMVCEILTSNEYTPFCIDPKRVHEINDGDYQGTLLYVIAEKGYQPSLYWAVRISYGSCSGCDAFQGIIDDPNGEAQVKDFMTLALHIVQGLVEIGGETA